MVFGAVLQRSKQLIALPEIKIPGLKIKRVQMDKRATLLGSDVFYLPQQSGAPPHFPVFFIDLQDFQIGDILIVNFCEAPCNEDMVFIRYLFMDGDIACPLRLRNLLQVVCDQLAAYKTGLLAGAVCDLKA